ncbi:glycosyltransferase family 2 protein [Winogradskyella ursingii]|uniref:glycosyltransferase family 2 protein n=1 Tax=Winogradskyella ursingii TaxID=2686079 RepID=UPI0015C78108|nr:glycosyltransferase [Winogradskyella ursingii]
MISIIVIVIIVAYLILIGLLSVSFDKVEDFKLQDLDSKTKFSVVIPFRNEAENLPRLLDSIFKLNYTSSLFEVILVDDGSEDESVKITQNILDTSRQKSGDTQSNDFVIIHNKRTSNSPKKDAITTAIENAKYDWIITTDADCVLPKYWLDAFDEYIQTQNPNCMIAPITYMDNSSFLKRFQTLDFLSLQGATIAGFGLKKPFLCNGANFAYRLETFKSVNGFEGNTEIASGDDVFLLEKFLKHNPKKVHYLKTEKAIVITKAVDSVSGLIQQRIRWASKTSAYDNWFGKMVGLIVFLANLASLMLIPLVVFNLLSFRVAVALFVIKFCIDFLILFKTARFFKQESLLISYFISSFIYPIFSVYVATLSLFQPYKWKGRTFKK